jgi:hypothetical protein
MGLVRPIRGLISINRLLNASEYKEEVAAESRKMGLAKADSTRVLKNKASGKSSARRAAFGKRSHGDR